VVEVKGIIDAAIGEVSRSATSVKFKVLEKRYQRSDHFIRGCQIFYTKPLLSSYHAFIS
jgi:hypothetical protein